MKAVRSQLFFVILLRKKISFRFNFQEDMNTAQHMLALHVIILIVWEIMNRRSKRPLCGTDDFGRNEGSRRSLERKEITNNLKSKYKGTTRENKYLKDVSILFGAFLMGKILSQYNLK